MNDHELRQKLSPFIEVFTSSEHSIRFETHRESPPIGVLDTVADPVSFETYTITPQYRYRFPALLDILHKLLHYTTSTDYPVMDTAEFGEWMVGYMGGPKIQLVEFKRPQTFNYAVHVPDYGSYSSCKPKHLSR